MPTRFIWTISLNKDLPQYRNYNLPSYNKNIIIQTCHGIYPELEQPVLELKHFVSVSKQGHIFSVGRFPEVDKFNFQDDKADMGFIDSTLIKVVGRVVGGLREANKKPGLDLSKNNIGVAKLQFLSQLGGGCAGDTVFTDPT